MEGGGWLDKRPWQVPKGDEAGDETVMMASSWFNVESLFP